MTARAPALFGIGCALSLLASGLARAEQVAGEAVPAADAPDGAEVAAEAPDGAEAAAEAPDGAADASDSAGAPPPAVDPDLRAIEATTDASDVEAHRRTELGGELSRVQQELDSQSTVLPWILIVVGVTATVVAVGTASIDTLGCERSCSTGVWQSFTVLGGATFTSVGTVWLTNVLEDRRQLDLRRDRIERELDNIHDNRPLSSPAPGLHIGGRF